MWYTIFRKTKFCTYVFLIAVKYTILEFQLQHQFFQWIFRTDFPQDGLVGSPCNSRDSQESSQTPFFKSIDSSVLSFLQSNSHIHTWLLEKPQLWLDGYLLVKSLLFNMLSRLVIPFFPRSKRLLISWLQSPSAVILEPKIQCPKRKYCPQSLAKTPERLESKAFFQHGT